MAATVLTACIKISDTAGYAHAVLSGDRQDHSGARTFAGMVRGMVIAEGVAENYAVGCYTHVCCKSREYRSVVKAVGV